MTTSARLTLAADVPPPATSARLIGQALHPPRLLTGSCSCLYEPRGHFRIEGGCSKWGGRGGVWEKVGAWGCQKPVARWAQGFCSWAVTAGEEFTLCMCEGRRGREKGASEVTFSQPAILLPGAP